MVRGWRLVWVAVATVAILAIAAYLRLANVANTPGWYTDEGTHILIAQNLVRGRVQYMAIGQSWLLFGRMPLFELLLAGVVRFAGAGVGALRSLTGLLGVISVVVLGLVTYCITKVAESGALAVYQNQAQPACP